MSTCTCGTSSQVTVVVSDIAVSCITAPAIFNGTTLTSGADFSVATNGPRLGAIGALKYRHCMSFACEPNIKLQDSAQSLLAGLEVFKTNAESNSLQTNPLWSDGQRDYFLNYITNACHATTASTATTCTTGCEDNSFTE